MTLIGAITYYIVRNNRELFKNRRKYYFKLCGGLRERSHMTSARFWQILPPPPPVSIERPPPPLMTSAFARPPPPPFQSDISFSKNPLRSTVIETLNFYLIQLKTERCHQFKGVYKCSSLTHSDRHALFETIFVKI